MDKCKEKKILNEICRSVTPKSCGGGGGGRQGEVGPEGPQGPPGPAGPESVELGDRNFFVSTDGDDTTGAQSDLDLNYLTITAALVDAVAATPTAANPYNIVIYPGEYVESITVPAFVNIIAATPTEFMYNVAGFTNVFTRSGGALGQVYINGNITQTGDNVKIIGINCNNLLINTVNTNSVYKHLVIGTAITSNQASVNGIFYDTHASTFLARVTLTGLFNYCVGGDSSFASNPTGAASNITGTMTYCVGGENSYASSINAGSAAGNITGRLEDCIALATNTFSSSLSGAGGTISGTLINCRATDFSFSSTGTGGSPGVISGTLINCAGGDASFASGTTNLGTISGTLRGCIGNTICFCSASTRSAISGSGITSTALLYDCIATGEGSFCSTQQAGSVQSAGNIAGKLFNCISLGILSFSSASSGGAGSITSTAILQGCKGISPCFCSSLGSPAGVIAGRLIDCLGGDFSFSSSQTNSGANITGTLENCSAGLNSFASSESGAAGNITAAGKLVNCVGSSFCYSSSDSGVAGDISGRLYDCFGGLTCYASSSSNTAGDIIGRLYDCRASGGFSYSSSQTGDAGTISGVMRDCQAQGSCVFASSDSGNAGIISGKLYNCQNTTGSGAFASCLQLSAIGSITGTLVNCNGLDYCFASGGITTTPGSISGNLFDCYGDNYCFASNSQSDAGTISGNLENCYCLDVGFASTDDVTTNGGLISGRLVNCRAVDNAFASSILLTGSITGTLIDCDAGSIIAFSNSVVSAAGRLISCRSNPSTAATQAICANNNAIFEKCSLKGNGAFGIASFDGGSYNIDARHCDFFGSGIDPNLTVLTATPYNTDDATSLF